MEPSDREFSPASTIGRPSRSGRVEMATFAAGCFWGVEMTFRRVEGVLATRVGYTGGTAVAPSYEAVCTGGTGHAESVEVTFDPEAVSYEDLLDIFWNCHDPTSLNRQGPDVGNQYRSAIFVHDETQRDQAERSRQMQQARRKFGRRIVTDICVQGPFYVAEAYHQQYLARAGAKACRNA